MEYKPDIIISVHPLMQHIPLWVLKWQGIQKKVIFVTVITDLNTCHPTWLVNKVILKLHTVFMPIDHNQLYIFTFKQFSGFILGLIDATVHPRK